MTDTAAPVPGSTQEAPTRLDACLDALPGADLGGAPASVPALDPLAPYDAILLQSYGGPRRPAPRRSRFVPSPPHGTRVPA